MSTPEHRYHIDRILEEKIQLFDNGMRYRQTVLNYLRHLRPTQGATFGLTDARRYQLVERAITELWVHSDKNPSIFKTSTDFEPVLQKNPYYRDHFIHSFNVFLMGYYIFNRLKQLYPQIDLKTNDYNLTWMLASTFHDVAYPLQKMEEWLNDLFEGFFGVNPKFHYEITQAMPLIYADYMRLIASCRQNQLQGPLERRDALELDWEFYNQIGAKITEREHGVLGGLMLTHLLAVRQGFIKKDVWTFLYNHLPACYAITVHHLDVKLSFETHPIAFMLVLLDELQDWGRPSEKRKSGVRVMDIDVQQEGDVPSIRFVVKGSKGRLGEIAKALSSRLEARTISISIEKNDGSSVFSLNTRA